MKIIKTSILLFLASIIISCGDSTPKCEDADVKNTVVELIQEHFEKETLIKIPIENIKLDLIKTTSVNKDIKQCDCEANVVGDLGLFAGYTVTYNAQKNEKGEVIVSAEVYR